MSYHNHLMAAGFTHETVQYHEFHKKFDLNPYQSFMEKHLQHYGYFSAKSDEQNSSRGLDSKNDDWGFGENSNADETKSNQLLLTLKNGKPIQKLREPRGLFALMMGPNLGPRYPFDMQVLPTPIKHIEYVPDQPEPLYQKTGSEPAPMVKGEERGGALIYQYIATHTDYFVRSSIHGNCMLRPVAFPCDDDSKANTLQFESRFESANLEEVLKVGSHEYELRLRYDLYTEKHTQWYYFQVSNAKAGVTYRFTIVNLMKSNSLYNSGMKPCFYSEMDAKLKNIGWRREGFNIRYYRNNTQRSDCSRAFYSLTFSFTFENGPEDKCYFAHCYPYTYSMLQTYLKQVAEDPVKSSICKQRILCKSLAGNVAYVLTITNPVKVQNNRENSANSGKKCVVLTARVHPGESNASWMMKGVLDYLLSNSPDANLLRDFFIFKIVPMLNPDGVIVGNYRCSLAGRDLNRNYKTVLRDAYPTIWFTRQLVKKMRDEIGVVLYVDLHGHSRKQNVFMYGCEKLSVPGQRLKSRVFPFMMAKNSSSAFSYKNSKFRVQKSKEGCGRICIWNLGITNSYTMESTFCGSTLGAKKGFHFNTKDLELLGYHLLDTLLDFSDPNPIKYARTLHELEMELKEDIMKKWEAKGIKRDISTISDQELQQMLEDISDSEVESETSGSDSSEDNGLPVHLMEITQQSLKAPTKRLKTKKELNNLRRTSATGMNSSGVALKLSKSFSQSGSETLPRQILTNNSSDNRTKVVKFLEASELRNNRVSREESASSKRSLMRYSRLRRENSLGNLREMESGPSRAAGLVDFSELCAEHQTSLAEVEIFETSGLTKKGTTRRDVSTQFTPLPQAHRHVLETSAAQQRQQDRLKDEKVKADSMLAPLGEWNSKLSNQNRQSLQMINSMQTPQIGSMNKQTMKNLEKAYKEQSSLHWLPKQIRKSNNMARQVTTLSSKDRIIPAQSLQARAKITPTPSNYIESPVSGSKNAENGEKNELPPVSLTERLLSSNAIGGLLSEPIQPNINSESKGFISSHLKLNGVANHRDFESSASSKIELHTSISSRENRKTVESPVQQNLGKMSKKQAADGINYLKASQERMASEERSRQSNSKSEQIRRNNARTVSETGQKIPDVVQKDERFHDERDAIESLRGDSSINVEQRHSEELNNLSNQYQLNDEENRSQSDRKVRLNAKPSFARDDSVLEGLKSSGSSKSSFQNNKAIKLLESNLSADEDNLETSLDPELLEIQELKVRLASAKSEARHRKLKFTDESEKTDNLEASEEVGKSSNANERENEGVKSTYGQDKAKGWLTPTEVRLADSNSSDVNSSQSSLLKVDSQSNFTYLEHNLKLNPRPIADHSLVLNRDLRPPIRRFESNQKKKADVDNFFKAN